MSDPTLPARSNAPARSAGTPNTLPPACHVGTSDLSLMAQNPPSNAPTVSVTVPPCAAAVAQSEYPGNSSPNQSAGAPPKLMITSEVAAFFNCTERTIRNWRRRGVLRARRVGGSVFCLEDEVVALLNDVAGEEEESENE